MGIFRAVGFGLFLLILTTLMPRVFFELSDTLVALLQSLRQAFVSAGILATYAGNIPLMH